MGMEQTIIKKENGYLHKIVSIACTILLAFGSYYLNETRSDIKEMSARITRLERFETKTEANQFTSLDWQIQKTLIDSDKVSAEKRLATIETNIIGIKEDLKEIKDLIRNKNAFSVSR